MKPFNLEEALAGNPVQLRGGDKAYVYYKFPDSAKKWANLPLTFPLIGCIVNGSEQITNSVSSWRIDGLHDDAESNNKYDIVGMWQEPTQTVTVTLPKPFKPKEGERYYSVVARCLYSSLIVSNTVNANSPTDNDLINSGNAFRKEEDAQAWIDAMIEAKRV